MSADAWIQFPAFPTSMPFHSNTVSQFSLSFGLLVPATNLRPSIVAPQGPESLFGRYLCLVVPVSRSVRSAFTDFERNTEGSIDMVKPRFECSGRIIRGPLRSMLGGSLCHSVLVQAAVRANRRSRVEMRILRVALFNNGYSHRNGNEPVRR